MNWEKLSEDGQKVECGWLTDKFGLSWQVVPRQLSTLLSQGGPAAGRVMSALMQMKKLDIATLEAASRG